MNTENIKIAIPVAAFISVAAAIAHTQLKNDYPTDIVDLQNYIAARGTLSTADHDYPASLAQRTFRMELESCLLRVEVAFSQQHVCTPSHPPDFPSFVRTELQLSDALEVSSLKDDIRGTSTLMFSIAPSFRNDPKVLPITKSGTQCDGRRAETYKSKHMELYTFPKDVATDLEQAIRQYTEEFC